VTVWVAYNRHGDLIAEADNENDLLRTLAAAGIDEDEVFIGRVTP
jgi:hypothetical protein